MIRLYAFLGISVFKKGVSMRLHGFEVANDEGENYKGYRGKTRQIMEKLGVVVWMVVEFVTNKGCFSGVILPRSENDDDMHIVMKLESGYNTGVLAESIIDVKVLDYRKANYRIPEKQFPYDTHKPKITLLGTGGTIASRLDYRTGAVIPAFSPGELYGAVPELADICNIETKKLFGIFSENMTPSAYITLAKSIVEEIEKGVDGIVIGHGTDTLHHTAAALSFMVQDLPVPVVLVGSQRSSDRPSSDAAYNLLHACWTAGYGDIAEVMVCMFGPTSDTYSLLHRGTRVRKMHSSYRSTFRTISDIPLAMVNLESFTHLKHDYRKRDKNRKPKLIPTFEERVTIQYYYPNMHPDIITALVDLGYKGIVIAGTGLGHVNKPLYPALRYAHEKKVAMYMTVQTLWGFVHMNVYETGRDIQALGVIPAQNMLPEVAYVKLGWALGQTHELEEVKNLMLNPIAGEITDKEPPNGYIILQGGLPEVEEFLAKYLH